MRFDEQFHEKPWGRQILPSPFGQMKAAAGLAAAKIGEIWFQRADGDPLPLLVKYLFTSERLSVQVHPDEDDARARGAAMGKNECWYILDAEPGAMIGLGTKEPISKAELRAAALDGSIEQMMNWKAVKAGEFYSVPAGTLHVIGAGISLIEFQQNSDITYRLYDYGRPRELHLDDGVAVANMDCPPAEMVVVDHAAAEQQLAFFPQFEVIFSGAVMDASNSRADRARWVVPLSGRIRCDGKHTVGAGGCLYLAPGAHLDDASQDARALIGIANRFPAC